ncbi:hypothetical protein BT63DRAFT_5945 [Microthyrium microscopicum]|uniref:Uncharacterized protein n=1 Tax=Microthyrium microscopicum TaxID=703497 RepID=A0A6A6US92_9PEZI|nr:hypothetical protein BT63DRAFT_5945 [Microthyrium microscopicum]
MGTYLYPMGSLYQYNLLRDGWYHLALTDEMFFTATIWSATDFLMNRGHSAYENLKAALEASLLQQLRDRITSEGEASDATLGSVSCLAMTGSCRGDPEFWSGHMKGMAILMASRGGPASIDTATRIKLYRADTDGAVEAIRQPFLPPLPRSRLSLCLELLDIVETNDALTEIVGSSGLIATLACIMQKIRQLSIALNNTFAGQSSPVDPYAVEEDTMIMERELLGILMLEPTIDGPNQACILGCLIYLRTLTRPLNVWRKLLNPLAGKLKVAMDDELTRTVMDDRLVRWLSFLGVMCSSDRSLRGWFVRTLKEATLGSSGSLPDWKHMTQDLEEISWVKNIHEEPGKAHWLVEMSLDE